VRSLLKPTMPKPMRPTSAAATMRPMTIGSPMDG
jgi:hypothetical protein